MRNLPFPALPVLLAVLLCVISLPAAAESISGDVVYVSDGDTLLLRTSTGEKEWIRLAEIDAPEKNQPGGLEAKAVLMQRVKGRTVVVDYGKRDGYGRLIGHIHHDGYNLNAEMVRTGNAWVYRRYSDSSAMLHFEQEARAQRIGLWAKPKPTPPWKWRRKQ